MPAANKVAGLSCHANNAKNTDKQMRCLKAMLF